MAKNKVVNIYKKLYSAFGPQNWWPADTPFEVMIGAILTQNTSWQNVEKAIANLKERKALNFSKMFGMKESVLSRLIRPAGYYNIKSRRIKNFLKFIMLRYKGELKNMARTDTRTLRSELLSVNGIGPETADSILLYAFNRPVFVVDAYTRRISSRHKMTGESDEYERVQEFFTKHLPEDTGLFNEYHALLVKLAKEHCKKTKPECPRCPIYEKN